MVGSGLGKVLKNLSGSTQSCVYEGKIQGRDVSRALDLKKLLQHGFGFIGLACTRINVSKSTSNGHDFACQSFRFVQSCDGLVEHPFLPKSDGETHVRQVIAGIELQCLAELLWPRGTGRRNRRPLPHENWSTGPTDQAEAPFVSGRLLPQTDPVVAGTSWRR